ncbi:MAG: hypothetical protein WCI74_02955 [Actinomycetes bacterium]
MTTDADETPASSLTRLRSHAWFDPSVIGVLGVLISAIGMWRPSFWTDEVASISSAQRSLGELWSMMGNIDAVHGMYYLFMHFYLDVVPANDFTLRLPSAVAVGCAGAGVVVAGRMLRGPSVGVLAGVVFIILPRVTWMGIEARSSAFVTATVIWVSVVLLMAIRTNLRRWWVVYSLGMLLALLLVVYAALLLLAHALTLLWTYRASLRANAGVWLSWLVSAVVAGVLALPFVLVVVGQSKQITASVPSLRGSFEMVVIHQYFLGQLPGPQTWLDKPMLTSTGWLVPALILTGLSWLLVALGMVRHRRTRSGDSVVSLYALTVPWIVVPTLVVLAYSVTVDPIYNPRYLAFTVPAVAMLIGCGIAALPRRWIKITAVVLLICCALPVYWSQRGPTSKKGSDWAITAAILDANATPGDVVIYTVIYGKKTATTRKIAIGYPLPTITALRDITADKTGAQKNMVWGSSIPLKQAMANVGDAQRIWVVMNTRIKQGGKLDHTTPVLTRYGYTLTRSWIGPDTSVYEFQKTPTPPSP